MEKTVILNRKTNEVTYDDIYKIEMHQNGGTLFLGGDKICEITHDTAPRGNWRWFGLSSEQVLCYSFDKLSSTQILMFSFLASIYEMYIRCQSNELLTPIIPFIQREIQKRSFKNEFLKKIKAEKLQKQDAKQILLFGKMGLLVLLEKDSISESSALKILSDTKLKII